MPEAISCAPIDGTGIAVELWRLPGQQAEDEGEAGASKQRDKEDIPGEEAQKQERDMTAEEKLVLKEFPAWKEQLEAGIQKLQVLADHVDNTHQTLARASLLTSLVAVFSGALGILGLLLGPAATGGSLLLSVASRGLGTAAGATSMLTGMLAHLHTQGVRVLARSLVSSSGQGAPESRGSKASCFLAMGKLACNGGSALWEVRKLVRAFQEVRAHPHLVSGGPGSRQVHRATGSSALVAAYSLGLDLLQGWRQPQEDMELALAEELRAWACRLQQELAELTQLQEHLQKLFSWK
ncbi:apolipoprotein L6-like isoform X2 [Erinaceus europaeus]|uniref:Apolipoprotein L6-like isoform X2 n=1 Tax=Erinaceus europaeus TaxID=9365 RepID=A0ABM3XB86_ERIEU|nr:apolipoprotein L6-like isoform X2 [Erinaceus europaeus]